MGVRIEEPSTVRNVKDVLIHAAYGQIVAIDSPFNCEARLTGTTEFVGHPGLAKENQ
jgi:hypothetical protein